MKNHDCPDCNPLRGELRTVVVRNKDGDTKTITVKTPKWGKTVTENPDFPQTGWDWLEMADRGQFKSEFSGPHDMDGGEECDVCETRHRYSHHIRHARWPYEYWVGKNCAILLAAVDAEEIEKDYIKRKLREARAAKRAEEEVQRRAAWDAQEKLRAANEERRRVEQERRRIQDAYNALEDAKENIDDICADWAGRFYTSPNGSGNLTMSAFIDIDGDRCRASCTVFRDKTGAWKHIVNTPGGGKGQCNGSQFETADEAIADACEVFRKQVLAASHRLLDIPPPKPPEQPKVGSQWLTDMLKWSKQSK
jgi:hypothetical protein